jgi:RNA polymerase sigma factor (sigma-70 family)
MLTKHSTSGRMPLRRRDGASRSDAEDLVLTTITQHADALLRTARRHSLCADDANDAYQRGLEIFMRHAARLDPARATSWLHTVIKHEAMAVRRSRQRIVGSEEFDGDALEARHAEAPDERFLAFEDVTRAAEALQGLKPQEVRALWLRMEGKSYKQIAESTGWTYTKVNRCVTEGRRAFLKRYAGIESGDECRRWEPVISAFLDGEVRAAQAGELRRHLRNCGGCRSMLRTLRGGERSLQGVLPVALVVGAADQGETATNLFVRIYEAVTGGVHERAMTVAAKAQMALEASGAGKVAAVAGTAAAVAGGGAVTVEHRTSDADRPVARVAKTSRPEHTAPRPASTVARIAAGGVTATVRAPSTSEPGGERRVTRSTRRASSRAVAMSREEFGVEGATRRAVEREPVATSAATTATSASASHQASSSGSTSPSTSTSSHTPSGAARSGASSSGGEFDLEP